MIAAAPVKIIGGDDEVQILREINVITGEGNAQIDNNV